MIYVQQVRSRKEPLVPLKLDPDSEMKIEYVNVSNLNGLNVVEMEPEVMEISSSTHTSTHSDGGRPRKRAKLDHLSLEEKMQHRKKMNRISAQSARDRQKALMDQQEKTINNLSESVSSTILFVDYYMPNDFIFYFYVVSSIIFLIFVFVHL